MDYEIDWDEVAFASFRGRMAITRLEQLHEPIEQSIRSTYRFMESSADVDDYPFDFDFEDEWAQIEDLLGMAFVAAQTHLTVVHGSMVQLSKYLQKTRGAPLTFTPDRKGRDDLFRHGDEPSDDGQRNINPFELKSGHSYVTVVNAVANYWKHHDEWPEKYESAPLENGVEVQERRWNMDEANTKSAKITMEIVMAIGMRPGGQNMQCAASTLGISDFGDLSPLRKTLKDWGESLLGHV